MPNDKVWLCSSGTREGPYTVESTNDGKYTLCEDNGDSVNSGQEFEEDDLVLFDPFVAGN